jgi:hypothetical protein
MDWPLMTVQNEVAEHWLPSLAQILKPFFPTTLSVLQISVSPPFTNTPFGPFDPQYFAPLTVR